MDAGDLEICIRDLERLLLEDPDHESPYQALFETHPVVLRVLGYLDSRARPRLDVPRESTYFEPDFLAVRPNGLWEIVDLKTPNESLTLGLARRERFTAKVASYLAQVHEYDEYFDDFEHRALTMEKFGVDVQKRPHKVLVIGRDHDADKREIHHQLSRLGSRVDVLTFDDVLMALRQAHDQVVVGSSEPASGLSMYLQLALSNPTERRRGYILDFVGRRGNRLSLFLNERARLVLEVTTDEGEQYSVPIEVPRHSSSEPLLLALEAGVRGHIGIMEVRIDGAVVGQLNLVGSDVRKALGFDKATLGNATDYSAGGWFGLFEWVSFDRPLDFRERLQLVDYFIEKRESNQSMVVFDGSKGMDLQNLDDSFRRRNI